MSLPADRSSPWPPSLRAAIDRLSGAMESVPARQASPSDPARRYGAALLLITVALGLREMLGPAEIGLQFVTFFPAVALAAVYGGFGAGMFATALSAVLATFLYIPPFGKFVFAFDSATLVSNTVFILDELMVCGAIQAMHNHYRNLRYANDRLTENRNLLHAIVEGTTDIVFLKDTECRLMLCNSVHARVTGKTFDEIAGLDPYAAHAPEQARALMANDRKVLRSGRVETFEEILKLPDGEERHFLTTKGPIFDEHGKIKGIFGIARDVTERKAAEKELRLAKAVAERANNAKSRFLAAVSHDLRQPLSALSLYVGALGGKLPAAADAQLLANMKDCVGSLSEMLSNLLDLSKLEAGVVLPKVDDFSLDAMFTKIASTQAPAAQVKGLALRFAYFGIYGRTDPLLFQRILANLVANAIRYTEEGGVLVGCRRRYGKTWVEVWDTGVGIPADKTAEIFEEFKQLGNVERNRAKGSGLGLTIVAKTAAVLGLQIRVRSKMGKGSLFAVELPRGSPVLPSMQPQYAQRPLCIALVEDNADVAKALSYALTEFGHRVLAAASRSELMPLLEDRRPDILISDYRLAGGETGVDVVAAMRARFGAGLPAMIITGDTDPGLIRAPAETGIALQHKPLDFGVLRATIARLAA